MYLKDGCLWGITIDKKTGKHIHTNHGMAGFDTINDGDIFVWTAYSTVWTKK